MSEEQKVDQYSVVEDKKESADNIPAGQKKAIKNGWTPREEWEAAGNDPEEWVSWDAFNVRGTMIGQVRRAEAKANELAEKLEKMAESHARLTEFQEKQFKEELAQAKQDLKEAKLEAMKEGEFEKAEEIDDKIKEVDKREEELSTSTQAESKQSSTEEEAAPPTEVVKWLETHEKEMKDDQDFLDSAEAYSALYAKRHPDDYDPAKAVDYVDGRLKKEFPQYYGEKRKSHMIESGGDGTGESKKAGTKSSSDNYTLKDCNPEEAALAKRMAGVLNCTPNEYVAKMAKENVLEVQQGV